MLKKLRTATYYFFAFLGVVIVLVAMLIFSLISLFFSDGGDFRKISDKASPNKQMVATAFVSSGGGAAGWCNKMVTVSPVNVHLTRENYQQYEVYWQDCSDPVYEWASDQKLTAKLVFAREDDYRSFAISPSDASGKVRVNYTLVNLKE